MSAEVLLEAATDLRDDHPPCKCGRMDCPTLFFEAVALLLENEYHLWIAQDIADPDGDKPWLVNNARRDQLVGIARAYLGSDQ